MIAQISEFSEELFTTKKVKTVRLKHKQTVKHENLNGRIQSVLAKARGFINFDRFRINVLFYFGKLNLTPLKI